LLRLRYIKAIIMNPELIIPILAISTGIIIPLAVFIWQYYDAKGKRETVLEISKHLDDLREKKNP